MSRKEMRAQVRALIDKYEFEIDPDAVVDTLGMAQRQMVEILKALSADAKLIIMDEPTSSLSAAESEKLFETIDGLRKAGKGILYISHRLEEVYRLSDRLTVMRDGKVVAVLGKDEINAKTVTTLMIGHEPRQERDRSGQKRFEDNCLEVRKLSYGSLLSDISFTAYGGEILGIGGLVGSGRTELIRCIYGAAKQSGGEILFNGKSVTKSIAKNIRMGFGLVPEDRRVEGFIPVQSIEKNIAIASHDRLANFGIVSSRREAKWATETIRNYDIRPTDKDLPVANLSGGNQQKVVLGRWLSRNPKLLLLDEPTVGVDVGVKAQLYDFMRKLAENGAIIIMVSSDLSELTRISDRILVVHKGRFFEEFTHGNVSQASVLLASSGEHTQEGRAL
jgi:ribose transport system ATP-binding protein